MPRNEPEDDDPASEPAATRPSRLQMADIARLANVSISTVSRALNHSPRLSAQTRQRINELAASLHYSVDAGAQMMRGKALQTVAVAFPYHLEERQHFKDPFFLALIGAIGDALIDSGHHMLIVAVQADSFELATKPYETRQAIGTILLGQEHNHRRINEMAVRASPLVVWGARLPDQVYRTVGSDNRMGGRQAAEHLLDAGAARIAFLGNKRLPEVGHRFEGYRDAHRDRGRMPEAALYRPVPFVAAAVQAEIGRMLDDGLRFDAVQACSDRIAMAAMSALRARGLRVPQDVQVVGFDDIDGSAHAHPPLTTVRQSVDIAGQTLVSLLLAGLRGEAVESVVMPTTLVLRESTLAGATSDARAA